MAKYSLHYVKTESSFTLWCGRISLTTSVSLSDERGQSWAIYPDVMTRCHLMSVNTYRSLSAHHHIRPVSGQVLNALLSSGIVRRWAGRGGAGRQ
ncbi:hypothetical protein J6590_006031 [Homalodisca vitripennis]|nr:hypothetical protein J6590_006031 [Homalodisca vitripennis]